MERKGSLITISTVPGAVIIQELPSLTESNFKYHLLSKVKPASNLKKIPCSESEILIFIFLIAIEKGGGGDDYRFVT
jgi:hypothetical protein